MTVAVIGLGDLGLACALRLHDTGHTVIGVDLAAERRAAWQQSTGLEAASGLDGLLVDQALVCVRTTSQASEVLAQLTECDAGTGLVVYVVTTLDPAFARGLADYGSDSLRVVELPVSGGRAAARSGSLTVLIGGDQAREGDIGFVQRALAQQAFEFPRFGDATLAKLVNNVACAYNAAAFATCLTLADRAGLPAEACADVIRVSSGGSWVADSFEALIGELLVKDAALLAAELGQLPAIKLADAGQLLGTLTRGKQLLSRSAARTD